MKNILLLILVATIPFMSVAQKKTNKKSNARLGEFVKKSPSEYEYMIIQGVQSTSSDNEQMMGQEELADRADAPAKARMKGMIKSKYRHFIRIDTGKMSPEQKELNKIAASCFDMTDALFQASKMGWEFVNASHVSNEDLITHYFYMKRKRDKKK